MIQRLRDWWTMLTASAMSREYDEAMDRKYPGHLARQETSKQSWQERHRREQEWFGSLVAVQQAGRIDEAERQTMAELDAGGLSFVLDPLERLADLYALEVDRLLGLGDTGGARVAANHAWSLMQQWASGSTSGGEGTARSRAAEELRRSLDAKLAAHAP